MSKAKRLVEKNFEVIAETKTKIIYLDNKGKVRATFKSVKKGAK